MINVLPQQASFFRTIIPLLLICAIDIILQLIETYAIPMPMDKNQIIWGQLSFYIGIIVLILIIHFLTKDQYKPHYYQLIMDLLFFSYFCAMIIMNLIDGKIYSNNFRIMQIYIYFHIFQSVIKNSFIQILIVMPMFIFALFELIQWNNSQSNQFYIRLTFLICIGINEMIIKVCFYQQSNQEYLNLISIQQKYETLSEIFCQINQGIVIYDPNFNCLYKNRYIQQIIKQSNSSCDLIQTNRMNSDLPLVLDQELKDEILDVLIVKVHGTTEQKRQLSVRELLNQFDQINNSSIYYTISFISNTNKIKLILKISSFFYQNKFNYLLTFYQIEGLIEQLILEKDRKFKQSMVNSFTHKLKTPLHSVLTYLEAAQTDKQVNTKFIEQYIKPSIWNSKLQLYLIQDVIDYVCQNSFNRSHLNIKNVNLINVIQELYDLLSLQCQQKRIDFLIYLNDMPFNQVKENNISCYLCTDQNKLTRILLNLLNNAYRFTNQNGTIKLTILESDPQFINNRLLKFIVSDNGIGINPILKDDITNQIQYLSYSQCLPTSRKTSTQDKQASTRTIKTGKNEVIGISLKIVTKLINSLNKSSTFNLSSIIGSGSEFSFVLYDLEMPSAGNNTSLRRQNKFSNQFQPEEFEEVDNVENESSISPIKQIDRIKPSHRKQLPLNKSNSFRAYQTSLSRGSGKLQGQASMKQLIPKKNSRHNLFDDNANSIVIVDDEPFNHISLEMMLKGMGFVNILHCYNGQEVIDLMLKSRNQRIKAILMDLDMPIMDGLTSAKILGQMMDTEKIHVIPIIACTAHEDEETRQKCFDTGMAQIVVKPVFPSILQEALNEINQSLKNI